MNFPRTLEIPVFLVVFALALFALKPAQDSSHIFQGDDFRYINYAVSLHKHSVFGLQTDDNDEIPQPGKANAPLYPALIAGYMKLDSAFAESLFCVLEKREQADCSANFQGFFLLQTGLALLTLFLIYLISFIVSGRRIIGWLATALALGSGVLSEFSYVFMVENLILPVFSALLLFCVLLYRDGQLRWILALGITLGILTLIRPSYLYLFYGFTLFFAFMALKQHSLLKVGVLILGFLICASPWAIRNKMHFDSYALSGGNYAEAILIQRTHYNQMAWNEIGAAMIYYLPDFGDSLAQKIFPETQTEKFGWGGNSYHHQGYAGPLEHLSEKLGGKDKVMPYLIRTELLSAKHLAVSLPLVIRGIFISKYWGLAGFLAFCALLLQTVRQKNYALLVMSLPLFFMVAFHAGLSVSLPRYNLPLIVIYSLSMAHYIHFFGQKFVTKINTQ